MTYDKINSANIGRTRGLITGSESALILSRPLVEDAYLSIKSDIRELSVTLDNGNNGVLLYSNVMENTGAYGMWIELSSTGCWVFNNTITNASFAIVAVSAAGHRFIGNRLLDPNCANGQCGTIVFGVASKGPARLGDIFASNTISGTNVSHYSPGSQGGLANNWFFDNDFVGATNGEVFGRYLGYSTSEISIFDIAPPHKSKRPI